MVDLNYTLLVQLANFIFLIFVVNALLLKPVMKHLAERDGKIGKSHEEAKENAERAEALLDEFEHELAATRVKAKQAYSVLQQEGLAEQRARLAEAKAKSQQMIEKAQAEIDGDAKRAREILGKEMEKLPKVIASKLLGREL